MTVSARSLSLERVVAALFTCAPTHVCVPVCAWLARSSLQGSINSLGSALCCASLPESCAGQELKELNSLIATASRKPLCRNDCKSKIPFLVTLFTLWCILYISTECTSAAITTSKTSDTLLQRITILWISVEMDYRYKLRTVTLGFFWWRHLHF